MSTLCLLGRQPAIGLAELESLYGADAVRPIGTSSALVTCAVDFARLGGTIKTAEHLTTLDTINPQKAFDYCRRALPDHISDMPVGKIKLGVSLYDLTMPLATQNANVLTLKKTIRRTGRSVRAIPNTEPALSSAQSYHNAVTSSLGLELVFVRDNDQIHIGQVAHVQDIDSYTLRDRGRPKRDAFVGMLPPKLAQVIINLAVGEINSNFDPPASGRTTTILDPFCGTGVILQEAVLMGYGVYGTDISPKMIDYSEANLQWLQQLESLKVRKIESTLAIADATTHTWQIPTSVSDTDQLCIATESYLGQPIGGNIPTPEKLQTIISECDMIVRGFLRNIARQLPPGTRLCIAVPAWTINQQVHHLPVLDELPEIGFDRMPLRHASDHDLIYRRDDQPTGRELLVLKTK